MYLSSTTSRANDARSAGSIIALPPYFSTIVELANRRI
jgi:hypothetical protein